MPQYEDHIRPVMCSLIGLFLSAATNLYLMCSHHDRPFQLMSTVKLRLNIVLGVSSPFIFIAEFIIFIFFSHFDFIANDQSTSDLVFLSIPVLPLLLSSIAAIFNIKLTSPIQRSQMVDDFVHQANEDEEMLLKSQSDGIPNTSGSIIENNQAFSMITNHYNPIFYGSIVCCIFNILFTIPWFQHILNL